MNERNDGVSDVSRATSVGIIMDGNRRWAKARGAQTFEGHAAGLSKAKEIVRHAFSRGVKAVTLYAFSTENWKRSTQEVGYLMDLFGSAMVREFEDIAREGVHVRFIGDLSRVPENLRAAAAKLEEKSAKTASGKTLGIALSYGGRAEILAAMRRLFSAGKNDVAEEDVNAALWSAGMRDPDIIIRTGGEKRLSGFLTWQSIYSELFFSDSFWPAFTKEEFDSILADFALRERRLGT
ncbi:MAG: polyprenyl diphosphate synthase [Minisyncoccia bacterium]